MDQNSSEEFRTVPNVSASFGNVPQTSETFGIVRNDSEAFRNVPNLSERKESHTLTVREAAKMFEAAGVARTERSIVNWCQPNKLGIARLDSYFDPNERKYYITPQSVELAIQEEKAKAIRNAAPYVSEPFGNVQKDTETRKETPTPVSEGGSERVGKLEKEILDLKILNGGKDFLIEQLRKEREGLIGQVVSSSRKIGQLETKLLQLGAPMSRDEGEGDQGLHHTNSTL